MKPYLHFLCTRIVTELDVVVLEIAKSLKNSSTLFLHFFCDGILLENRRFGFFQGRSSSIVIIPVFVVSSSLMKSFNKVIMTFLSLFLSFDLSFKKWILNTITIFIILLGVTLFVAH